jgi:7-carboxy-7-deazaguanine synthase
MRCPGWPCDTQHAIDPAIWRFQSEKLQPFHLAHKAKSASLNTGAKNFCLTGGEPFMQNHDDLRDFVKCIAHPSKWCSFEVFTNGSFKFPEWTKEPMINMHFMMDWKLLGSGEASTNVDIRYENAIWLKETDGIKFVVKNENDLVQARMIYETLMERGCKAQFWVGAVWGEMEDARLVDFIQQNRMPWNLNVQVHKYIWAPEERGV